MKTSLPNQDIQAVSTFATSLAGAVRNYGLYPGDHAIATRHATRVHTDLLRYLAHNETLRLQIDRGRLLYEGEPVLEGEMHEGNIAYLFARDGLEWIEFLHGIELWEVEVFLKLVNDYRMIDGENDENIVTALWEQDFPHIRYKSVDILALDVPTVRFSSFRVAPSAISSTPGDSEEPHASLSGAEPEQGAGTDDDLEEDRAGRDSAAATAGEAEARPESITITARGNDLWNLTPAEQKQLEAMVHEEEHQDNSNDVIEILLIILVVQNNETDFATVLDFLQERFIRSLRTGQFHLALKIARNLKNVRSGLALKKKWSLPLLDNFFTTISRPESLRDVSKFFLNPPPDVEKRQLEYLWEVLRQLRPGVLATLAPLTGKLRAGPLAAPMFELIVHHGLKKPGTLASVVDQLDEAVCRKLFPVVEDMRIEDATRVLTAMTRHPSVAIRRQALDLLIEWDILILRDVFSLVNDPDEEIRNRILALISRRRDTEMERLMLDYLEQENWTVQGRDHLLACYRALGMCGSHRSLPFLRHILMQRNLNTLFAMGGSVHKEGAARALQALRLRDAGLILEQGCHSMMPDTRSACRKVVAR
ncbi:MAG TPA: HEAT repeat domain-containing protein [Desulfobulbus sp.]|nr:HEAT repeat domain-containing protein [Desulfobulbus sp.]